MCSLTNGYNKDGRATVSFGDYTIYRQRVGANEAYAIEKRTGAAKTTTTYSHDREAIRSLMVRHSLGGMVESALVFLALMN